MAKAHDYLWAGAVYDSDPTGLNNSSLDICVKTAGYTDALLTRLVRMYKLVPI
jgi:hypothetical protein